MKFLILCILFINSTSLASVDFGVGTSSITSGRPVPSLALGIEISDWGLLYRSEGVRTTIYSQNAWTLAGYKIINSEKIGFMNFSLGAGLGVTHIYQTYRSSPTSTLETERQSVFGPHFSMKLSYSVVYLGFDTLLGLTPQIIQHIALNFQDVSHITFGFIF